MQASTLKDLADQGEAVLSYIEQYGNKATAQARVETIAGYKAYTMNLPYMNCSEFLNKLLTDPNEMKVKPDFAASYFRTLKGEWQFSLRSVGDFDVSRVAQAFGGGGHKNAAGFKVDVLPWDADTQPFLAPDDLESRDPVSGEPYRYSLPMVETVDGTDAEVKLGESSE